MLPTLPTELPKPNSSLSSLYRGLDSGGPGHRAQDGEMLGTPGCPRPGLKAGSTAGALPAGAGGILLPSPPPPQAAQVSIVNTGLAARPRTTQALRAPGGRQTPRLPRVKAEQVSRPGPWPLSTWASAAWTGRITGSCKARLRVIRMPTIMQKKKRVKSYWEGCWGIGFFLCFLLYWPVQKLLAHVQTAETRRKCRVSTKCEESNPSSTQPPTKCGNQENGSLRKLPPARCPSLCLCQSSLCLGHWAGPARGCDGDTGPPSLRTPVQWAHGDADKVMTRSWTLSCIQATTGPCMASKPPGPRSPGPEQAQLREVGGGRGGALIQGRGHRCWG